MKNPMRLQLIVVLASCVLGAMSANAQATVPSSKKIKVFMSFSDVAKEYLPNLQAMVAGVRKEVGGQEPFIYKKSPMPAGLFKYMTKGEILDLLAYLSSAVIRITSISRNRGLPQQTRIRLYEASARYERMTAVSSSLTNFGSTNNHMKT